VGTNVTHTYTDNGNYTVTLTVSDDDGDSTTSTIDVTVNNVAPTITNINYGEINEGVSTQFSADATDPGDDTLTYTWDFGDGSEPVTGRDVSHLFTDNGDYTITLTVSDEDGGSTTSQTTITAQEVFNIKAEGTVRINGSSDLDGEPLNFDDDTRIYAGEGFIINGNQTLPVLRDSDGNPIQIGRKSVLIDRAVTVGPNYTQSQANASSQKYTPLIPPQVIDELSVNVPSHDELVSSQLALLQSEGSNEITFNPKQNQINNVNDWHNYFPNNSNAAEPVIVRITNGNLNIPGSVNISNYVFVLDNGNINFNGSGHTLDNTALILNNGSINLASVQSRKITVLASGAINMNSGARFAGDSLIATGNSNGSINFNGATVNNEPSYLRVISQGNIIFNSSNTVLGEFLARKNFTSNVSSSIVGSVQTKGDIRFNGSATISSFS
jgi:PKD repeat protein